MEKGDNEQKRRQDDERVALESIYGDDVVDAGKSGCWKIWRPLDVIIHLRPVASLSTDGEGIFVSVDLHVKCSDSYPDSSPDIELKNAKGISQQDLKQLRQMLLQKCQQLKGTEVVMELCQVVQEYLYERNKPPEGSFHDGMLRQKAAVEHEKKRQRATSEQREREEVAAFQEIRKEKLMWKEAEVLEKDPGLQSTSGATEVLLCVDGTEHRVCRLNGRVSRRKPLHRFCREWTALEPSKNHEVLVSEWNFEYSLGRNSARKMDFNVQPFAKQLDILEREMSKIARLTRVDQSLYPYSFLFIKRKSLLPSNVSVRIIYGQIIDTRDRPLCECISAVQSRPDLLPKLALQVLYAIKWLNDSRLSHSQISTSTVWMTYKHSFRVSDYALQSILNEVCDMFEQCSHQAKTNTAPSSVSENAQKSDLIQLASVLEMFSDSALGAVQKENLKKFIELCRTTKSVDTLSEHAFVYQDDLLSTSLNSILASEQGSAFEKTHSRIRNEFIYLEFLGKGGFGDVVLARNKLDGNEYAVKRIPLDPRDEQLNKKVTREAKLFSRLNHPNVVRYYSAWIEQAPPRVQPTCSTPTTSSETNSAKTDVENDSLMPSRLKDVEARAANIGPESTAEWSVSFQKVQTAMSDSDSGSLEINPAPACRVRTLFSPTARSTSNNSEFEVLFEDDDDGSGDEEHGDSSTPPHPDTEKSGRSASVTIPRILFIQMEYCEQGTLRFLIESAHLFPNPKSVWRIFRETLLGLQYIHREGMIHRDIKPMNILLDGNGRVKIGDFGLATREFLVRQSANTSGVESSDASLTKDIGTALYIAPELLSSSAATADCTTKVDVYSLGIVLFEMFYRPLLPGMERIGILKALRNSLHFPNDFGTEIPEVHRKTAKELIGMMLKREPKERPSVDNLIESERVPLVEIEDSQFQKMFCQALRTRSGRMFQWMMDTIFAEPLPTAADFFYDRAVCSSDRLCVPRLRARELIHEQLSRICSLHAFIPFDAHSFAPSDSVKDITSAKSRECRFVDENGVVVSLPFDLRKTFSRYCARNGLNRLKRYALEKIFCRPDALGGIHPIERYEFAVDCIGLQSASHLLTAEVLCVILNVAEQFGAVKSRKWHLRIGHKALIAGTALYLGFGDDSSLNKILNVFYTFSTSDKVLSKEQKIAQLRRGTEMSFNQASSLLNILEGEEGTLGALRERLRPLLRARSEPVRELIKTAVDDITSCISILDVLTGGKSKHLLFDGTLCYRPQTFSSGLVCQLQVLIPHKYSTRPVIVCSGGRYDEFLQSMRHPEDPVPPVALCAVGCSFAVDVLAQLHCSEAPEFGAALCSAIVCSTSTELLKESASLVRRLWENGISADLLHDPVESAKESELIEHCEEKKIDHLCIIFGRDEVLVRSRGADLGKMSFAEAVRKCAAPVGVQPFAAPPEPYIPQSPVRHVANSANATASVANLNIHYAIAEKPAFNTKKRIEAQVRLSMQKALLNFTPLTVIEVVVCDLSVESTRQLVAMIDRGASSDELGAVFDAAGTQFNKYKRELKCVHEELETIFQRKQNSVVALFSRKTANGYYRFII